MLTSDLTSLVPLQFSPWLQVRKIGTIHLSIYLSNPKPDRIIWKRSDGILSSARTMVSKGNLTILNTTTQDNGFYVCTAANSWGTKSSSVVLHVY